MTHTHIVKIQRPLATNDPEPKVLIYNADRSIHAQLPMTEELDHELKGLTKAYFRAQLRKGQLLLLGRVADRGF